MPCQHLIVATIMLQCTCVDDAVPELNMDMRELKGLELAARCKIGFTDGAWQVPSQTSPRTKYRVTIGEAPSCQCEDWQLRQQDQRPCKHIIAARLTCARDHGGTPPKIDADTVPQRLTYQQNWPAYNEAQQQEKDRLQVLLADLCSGIVDLPRSKPGPVPVSLADRLFSVCFKVWSTLSSRRFNCDLQEAHERGHLSRSLHCNKVNSFMEDAELTPYLRVLVVRSALPLRTVETEFAVDSSGFSTSRFVKWFDRLCSQLP
jgi:SWIM zinc finger